MKKNIYLLVLISFSHFIMSQNMANNHWIFGEGAGLDFNSGAPIAYTVNPNFSQIEGVATISDRTTGNLLFYTNGINIYTSSYTVMPNGSGLSGHASSTQSGIIVPHPGNPNLYYVFTTPATGQAVTDLRYSVVDMTLNGGFGDVVSTQKNIFLASSASERITAVKHRNGTDVWVIAHDKGNPGNTFMVFLVTTAGLNTTPVISNVGSVSTTGDFGEAGYLKASHNGKLLAIASRNLTSPFVEVLKFNNSTGVVGPVVFTDNISTWPGSSLPQGLEFSSDNTKLYATGGNYTGESSNVGACAGSTRFSGFFRLMQYDLKAGCTSAAILTSRTQLFVSSNTFGRWAGALQIGPDSKIYVARATSDSIGVINNPNSLGLSCNYVHNGIFLNNGLNGICHKSQLGLPNFVQNLYPKVDSISVLHSITHQCDSFLIKNYLDNPYDSLKLIFGDPASGVSNVVKSLNTGTVFTTGHVFSSANTYTMNLIMYDGCDSDTLKKTVTVDLPVVTAIASNTSICVGITVTLTAGGANTYTWVNGPNTTTYTVNPLSSQVYTVIGTNTLTGCSNSQTVSINVGTQTVGITSSNSTLCSGAIATITPTGATTYTLEPGNITGTSFTVSPGITTTYTLTGMSTSTCLASNTVTLNITVNPTPTVSVNGSVNSQTVCSGANTSQVIFNVSPAGTVNWTNSNTFIGIGASGTGNIPSFTAPNVSNETSGIITVTASATNGGCSSTLGSSVVYTIMVNPLPTSTIQTVSTNSIITCLNPVVTLSVSGNPTLGINYNWSNASSSSTTTINSTGVVSVTAQNTLTGCASNTQYTVNSNTTPPGVVTTNTTMPCSFNPIIIHASGSPSAVTYTWLAGNTGSVIANGNTSSPTINGAGVYSVIVTNPVNGCTSTASLIVTQATVTAAFDVSTNYGIAPLSVDFYNQSSGASLYNWFLGDGNTTSIVNNPGYIYNSVGTYTVILIAKEGPCSDTAYTTIIVEDDLIIEIPNVFTPNKDGINDMFTIKTKSIKEISLGIYNRWGQKLYEYSGAKAMWDGLTPNGEKASDGTYFYIVKVIGFNGKEIERKGSVNLFR